MAVFLVVHFSRCYRGSERGNGAKAWRAEVMAVLVVSVVIGCRDSERSLRLLIREVALSIGLLMMT